MSLGQLVLAVCFFGGLVGIYILLYLLNKKTPKPAGCEDLRVDCEGCGDIMCLNNPAHQSSK